MHREEAHPPPFKCINFFIPPHIIDLFSLYVCFCLFINYAHICMSIRPNLKKNSSQEFYHMTFIEKIEHTSQRALLKYRGMNQNNAVLIILDFDTDFYFIGMLFLALPRMADT